MKYFSKHHFTTHNFYSNLISNTKMKVRMVNLELATGTIYWQLFGYRYSSIYGPCEKFRCV